MESDAGGDAAGEGDGARCGAVPAVPLRRHDPTTCAATPLIDQCTTDQQCPAGEACGCAADFYGNVAHTNVCVTAQCRLDSDCGPGGVCSPSFTGHCGSLTGYYCHSAADECLGQSDCCDRARPSCQYSPELGHWACQATIVCNG
ncbi:MAG TPA: hypothetical protein VFH68_26245 [Polyangia bacterium]|nr:hypothetical protein [Polyangia bacterium]